MVGELIKLIKQFGLGGLALVFAYLAYNAKELENQKLLWVAAATCAGLWLLLLWQLGVLSSLLAG